MIDVFEMYTTYNDEKGDWSNISCHTEGMLGIKRGSIMSLDHLNKAISDVGHPPLNKESFASNLWTAHEDDEGRFDYNYIGTSDGFPDKDGKYLYDISIWLYKVDPQPVSKDALFKEFA